MTKPVLAAAAAAAPGAAPKGGPASGHPPTSTSFFELSWLAHRRSALVTASTPFRLVLQPVMAAPPPTVAELLSSAAEVGSFIKTCLLLAAVDPNLPDIHGQSFEGQGHAAAICVGLAAHRASAEAQEAALSALRTIYSKSSEEPASGVHDSISAAMRAHPKNEELQDVGTQVKSNPPPFSHFS